MPSDSVVSNVEHRGSVYFRELWLTIRHCPEFEHGRFRHVETALGVRRSIVDSLCGVIWAELRIPPTQNQLYRGSIDAQTHVVAGSWRRT